MRATTNQTTPEGMSIHMNADCLEVLASLTLELTKIRAADVPHLCVENFAPALLAGLIAAVRESKVDADRGRNG